MQIKIKLNQETEDQTHQTWFQCQVFLFSLKVRNHLLKSFHFPLQNCYCNWQSCYKKNLFKKLHQSIKLFLQKHHIRYVMTFLLWRAKCFRWKKKMLLFLHSAPLQQTTEEFVNESFLWVGSFTMNQLNRFTAPVRMIYSQIWTKRSERFWATWFYYFDLFIYLFIFYLIVLCNHTNDTCYYYYLFFSRDIRFIQSMV